jgi:hypothetical protein
MITKTISVSLSKHGDVKSLSVLFVLFVPFAANQNNRFFVRLPLLPVSLTQLAHPFAAFICKYTLAHDWLGLLRRRAASFDNLEW